MKPSERRALVLTALPVEYVAVRAYLRDIHEEEDAVGTVYEVGRFSTDESRWTVCLSEVGAGNVGAATQVERALLHFRPSVAFFVGVAGGIKDVGIGDVVVATKVYGYESGKEAMGGFLPRPDVGNSAYRLIQRARAEARKDFWYRNLGQPDTVTVPRVFVGPIAAGEKVIASAESQTAKFLREHYGDALAVEMEGAGFLRALHAHVDTAALVIRGISDLLSGKLDVDRSGSQELASRNAAAFAMAILASLGAAPWADELPSLEKQRRASEYSALQGQSAREQILTRLLSPYDLSEDLARYRDGFVGRLWLEKRLQEWLLTDERLLWITGGPGAGKSAALSFLYERDILAIKALFLFGEYKGESREAKCIETVLWQLCSQMALDATLLDAVKELSRSDPIGMLRTFFRVLERWDARPKKTFIIFLDGLDVLTIRTENRFSADLKRYIAKDAPHWLKFVVGSQPDAPGVRAFGKSVTVRLESELENRADLMQYVTELYGQTDHRVRGDARVNRIVSKSEGLFLYVKLVCRTRTSLNEIDVEALPNGIEELFYDLFLRIVGTQEGSHFSFDRAAAQRYAQDYAIPLSMIITTHTPVLMEDARDVFGLENKRLATQLYSTLRHLLKEDPKAFVLYHPSIKQWITNVDLATEFCLAEDDGHERWIEQGEAACKRLRQKICEGAMGPDHVSEADRRLLRQLPHSLFALQRLDVLHEVLADPEFFFVCYADNISGAFHMWADFCRKANSPGGASDVTGLRGRKAEEQIGYTMNHFVEQLAKQADRRQSDGSTWNRERNEAIGSLCFQMENYESASAWFQKALDVVNDADEVEVKAHLHNYIGESLIRMPGIGDKERAREHFDQAYRLRSSATLGREPTLALVESLHNCGHYYFMTGNPRSALEQYYIKAEELARELPGAPYFVEADACLMAGQCMQSMGETENARRSFEKSMAILDNLQDDNSWRLSWMVVLARKICAAFFLEQREFGIAEEQLVKAWEVANEYFGPYQIKTITCLTELYRVRCQNGRSEGAIAALEEILESYDYFGSPSNSNTFQAVAVLSESVLEIGGVKHARPLLEKYMRKAEQFGETSERALLQHNLGYVYLVGGKVEGAIRFLTEAFESRRRLLDVGDEFTLRTLTLLVPALLQGEMKQKAEEISSCYLAECAANLAMDDVAVYGGLEVLAESLGNDGVESAGSFLETMAQLGRKAKESGKEISATIAEKVGKAIFQLALANRLAGETQNCLEHLKQAISWGALAEKRGTVLLYRGQRMLWDCEDGKEEEQIDWMREVSEWFKTA